MEDLLREYNRVIVVLVTAFFMWLIVAMTRKKSKRKERKRILNYSLGYHIITVLSTLLAILSIYGVFAEEFPSRLSTKLVLILAPFLFSFLAGVQVYHSFFIRFSYDNQYVYYKSPLLSHSLIDK